MENIHNIKTQNTFSFQDFFHVCQLKNITDIYQILQIFCQKNGSLVQTHVFSVDDLVDKLIQRDLHKVGTADENSTLSHSDSSKCGVALDPLHRLGIDKLKTEIKWHGYNKKYIRANAPQPKKTDKQINRVK